MKAMMLLTAILVSATGLAAPSPQTGTRVTLNVVALDSHGQIAGDLTSQDFQVSDQGKPQRIVSFHRNGEPQVTPNNEPNAAQVGPPVIILFDLLNDSLGNRGYGTQEIIKALEPLRSSDSLYLYLLSSQGELKPVRGLPSPQALNPPDKAPWTEHIRPLLEAAVDNASGVTVLNTLIVNTSSGTGPALETLGAALRPFPGRKNLIWITSGVNPSLGNPPPIVHAILASSLVSRIATALDHDGVTLNGVHQGNNVENGVLATLEQFAELTGGKVYSNDIQKAVTEVMAASRSGYAIEYDAPRLDGKYHKIRVTCSRKGIRLQVKQGYYAN